MKTLILRSNKLIISILLILVIAFIADKEKHSGYILIAFVLVLGYIIGNYYNRGRVKLIYNHNHSFIEEILEKCPSIKKQKFYPSFVFQTSLLQTVIATVLPTSNDLKFNVESLQDPDYKKFGITLSWVTQTNKKIDDSVIVFILPGLTGKSGDYYIQSICKQVISNGYTPVVYNYRIFSETLKLPKEEIVDLIDDVDFTLQYIRSKFPSSVIYGVGHSYGANQLVNYLGRMGDQSILSAGVSLANPYTMMVCKETIKPTIFDYLLARILAKGLSKNKSAYEEVAEHRKFNVQGALNAKRVEEYDFHLIIHLFGYKSTEDYYVNFSSSQQLKNIRVPLLAISAKDDFISHEKAVPYEEFYNNPNLLLMMTNSGGHVGWVEGDLWKMKQWFPKPTMEFINAMHKRQQNSQSEQLKD